MCCADEYLLPCLFSIETLALLHHFLSRRFVLTVALLAWRESIGSLFYCRSFRHGTMRLLSLGPYDRVSPRLARVIAVLQDISSVELNPCSVKLDYVMHRLDALLQEVKDTRSSLAIKIDNYICDITAKIYCIENIATSHPAHINAVEQTNATSQLASLEVLMSALTALCSSTAFPVASTVAVVAIVPIPFATNDAVRKLDMLISKRPQSYSAVFYFRHLSRMLVS